MKYKPKRRAFNEILHSQPVEELINEVVENIMHQLPEGYAGGTEQARTRVRGYIYTHDFEAIYDNYKNHTLLKALLEAEV